MSKKNSQVYVSRFSRNTTEDDLSDAFKQYGKIREISMKNGYAFLEFDDHRDADEAVDRMDGKSLDGHKLIVELAGANKKGKKSIKSGVRGPQPGDKCFNCGKTGHWANECRESKGRRRRSHSSRSKSDSRSSSSGRDRKRRNKSSKKYKRSRSRSESKSRSRSSKRYSSKSKSRSSRSKSSRSNRKKGNGDNNKKNNETEVKVSKEEETTTNKDIEKV